MGHRRASSGSDTLKRTLNVLVALYHLGRLSFWDAGEFARAALEALPAAAVPDSVLDLLWEPHITAADASSLWHRAVSALGFGDLSPTDARDLLLREVCAQIVRGEADPVQAAAFIALTTLDRVEWSAEIAALYGHYSQSHDERARDPSAAEHHTRRIVEIAREVLEPPNDRSP